MKHTVTMLIHQYKYGPGFLLMGCDMTEYGYVLVGSTEVNFEVPDNWDPRPAQIAALQEKQRAAGAAFATLTIEISRQISELSAIEYVAAVV